LLGKISSNKLIGEVAEKQQLVSRTSTSSRGGGAMTIMRAKLDEFKQGIAAINLS